MGMRRGVFKLKAQLPPHDEDTESDSEPEVKRECADASSSSFDGSSSDEDSDVGTKRKEVTRKSEDSSSSSGSSTGEDSEEEEKPRIGDITLKKSEKESSSSSSSDEDSSASDPGSSEAESELEEEQLRKTKEKSPSKMIKKTMTKTTKKSTAKKKNVPKKSTAKTKVKESGFKGYKRLKRMSISGSSSDEASDLEGAQQLESKGSVKIEVEDDDTEAEMDDEVKEEARGFDTDSEEDWQPESEDEESNTKSKRKRDEIVEDSDEEWQEDELEDIPTEDEDDEEVCLSDVKQAKFVLRNITSHVPLIEETAIRRGVKLSGPPLEFATTHLDEYARKFRWPQHFRNLRNTNFSQDKSEILEDYEVLTEIRQPDSEPSEQGVPNESPFAQVPRPMVALAAEALRRSSRKRKRAAGSGNRGQPSEHAPSAAALLNTARVGGQFGDHFVESLLSANGKALQGIIDSDIDYDKRCWYSLPTKKKPIANWRFVLEHVRRTKGRSESDGAAYPPMKQETLERITKRLKKLYGHTTQHEEYDVFAGAAPTSSNNATEAASEEQTGQNSE